MRSVHLPGRSTVHARNGMCATSHPLASLHAVNVLRDGGNAVDAAVTAAAVLCVAEPHMTGIGGDCFALVAGNDGAVSGLDASGRAAMSCDEDWLISSGLTDIAPDSIHAVTVPGALDGWNRLLEKHGTMDLAAAFAPAIGLAEEGYVVAPRVARDWAGKAAMLSRDEGASMHYLIDGRAPRAGDIHSAPALARTLRLIGEQGVGAFYEGEIAEDIVACLKSRGSKLEPDDFARVEATWVDPVSTRYGGFDILEMPPAGQGVTALLLFDILKQFDLSGMDPGGPERFHIEMEATRLAYDVRDRYLADPTRVDVPSDFMRSEDLARELAGEIDPGRRMADFAAAVGKHHSDTVYLTVVDKDRTAVSFINSLYGGFGAGVATPKSGVMLHNRGACFVAEAGHPNCIGPDKRPLHTIIPAMLVKDGMAVMPFGVMGGAYQATGHAHVVSNIVDYGMDVQEALDFPRAFYEADGTDRLTVEEGVDPGTVVGLRERAHPVVLREEPLGGGQAIMIDRDAGTLTGGSDPRKDGLALGY